MLKSLKGTFQNVQQDIVDGLRALTSLDSAPRHERYKQLRAEGISLDAGADLLYRYQKEWADIQSFTTESAKRAEEVDTVVSGVFTRCERQWTMASQLEEEAATLPKILTTLQDIKQLIGSLQEDFRAVEEELDQLENLSEEQALEKEKASHMAQLVLYRKVKEEEAHKVKEKLWKILKDGAREVDARKSHALMERQEAFQDAFSSDMDYYRTHGHTDRLPSGAEFPKVSSLSDITIEEDNKALDEFLSSGEVEHNDSEGAFIEDDYTTDYRVKEVEDDDFPELDADVEFDDFDDGAEIAATQDNIHDTENKDNAQAQPDTAMKTDASESEASQKTNSILSEAQSSSAQDGENAVESSSGLQKSDIPEPVSGEENKEGT